MRWQHESASDRMLRWVDQRQTTRRRYAGAASASADISTQSGMCLYSSCLYLPSTSVWLPAATGKARLQPNPASPGYARLLHPIHRQNAESP